MLTQFDEYLSAAHTSSMRNFAITPFLFILSGFAQIGPADTQVATLPLKHEQVAVYREALSEMKAYGPYDLIDLTGVLRPDEGDFATCMKGFPVSPVPQQIHRLSRDFARSIYMGLISSQTAADQPFSGYAGEVHMYSGNEVPPPPDKRKCRVVLSEIIFDANHHRAALNITISCPGGGHSETHVYKLHHGKWMHSADCGSGIS